MQHGIVLNISEGGAALQLLGTPVGGGVSKLRLSFPAFETPLETGARLAWSEPDGRAGVHFDTLSTGTRGLIREWLRTQPAQPSLAAPEPTAAVAPELDNFGITLGIIAERALSRTGAKGAAIAVGNHGLMICCASVGEAPAIHTPLRPDSGLSGYCLRTGKNLYCMDATRDDRVDAAAAKQLNMRSAALLPVHVSGHLAGILELFSDEPNAFSTSTTRDRLGRLLQFLAAAIEEYRPVEDPAQVATETSANSTTKTVIERKESPAVARDSANDFRELLITTPQHATGVPRTVIVVFTLLALSAALFWYFMQRNRDLSAGGVSSETAVANTGAVLPQIGLAPSTISAKAGDPFSVDLVLSDAQDISSAGLLIVHDPNIIKVVGVSAGDLLGPSGTIVHREQPGQVQVTTSVAPPASAISGNGVLCTVYFLAKSPGTSSLSINQLSLKDSVMQPTSARSSDATVTITR
jgi:hypothetical protein